MGGKKLHNDTMTVNFMCQSATVAHLVKHHTYRHVGIGISVPASLSLSISLVLFPGKTPTNTDINSMMPLMGRKLHKTI